MATFRLRHFCSVSTLKSIEPMRLVSFLGAFQDFFADRGCSLPAAATADNIDYQALVKVFLSPESDTPQELLDALFLVDEMSTLKGMDALLGAAAAAGLELESDSDNTPSDIAIQVWLLGREILEQKHAEQHLIKPQAYEHFTSECTQPLAFKNPSVTACRTLERSLDDWFEKKNRGRGTRVFVYAKTKDEVWFLIRHGEPFKREESLQDDSVKGVSYRPLKYDVIVYSRRSKDLRINAQSIGEKKLYCQQLGHHFFGDADSFSGKNKYTLEPLRSYESSALICEDIDGIQRITLVEIHLFWGGTQWETEIRKANDIFAALAKRDRHLPSTPSIDKAVFKVKFADAKTCRSVTISTPNKAQYTRDSDSSLVEEWLESRGFIVHEEVAEHAIAAGLLAGT